jgi:hypothetical protein
MKVNLVNSVQDDLMRLTENFAIIGNYAKKNAKYYFQQVKHIKKKISRLSLEIFLKIENLRFIQMYSQINH